MQGFVVSPEGLSGAEGLAAKLALLLSDANVLLVEVVLVPKGLATDIALEVLQI